MSVIVATAYMEEAARFDWLVAMDEGRVLATGAPADLLRQTGADNLSDKSTRPRISSPSRAAHSRRDSISAIYRARLLR